METFLCFYARPKARAGCGVPMVGEKPVQDFWEKRALPNTDERNPGEITRFMKETEEVLISRTPVDAFVQDSPIV
ncbi:hypothetical protein DNHGIG_19910 [Collibacillus ludicampi]|uniref:Uncharacterized protein n=1 Tax=Collibacillus ludicampi TaxID=2771369 RepID=A0AAV4LF38_9BACL|nr:hypothetical protein DNHGIG_19910 [Collibacillus ludicampi]